MVELSSADADYLVAWIRSKKDMLSELIKNIESRDAPRAYLKRYLKGLGNSLTRKGDHIGIGAL